jgi:thiol-disulfide isomerase/thioredoxin
MKKLGFVLLVSSLIFVSVMNADSNKKLSNEMILKTYDGKTVDINITREGFKFSQYKDKAVLMTFFGPMCPPCIIEMPHLIELQKEHGDKLQVVAIQVQMPMENKELASFVKKNKINYPVVNLNDAWDIVSFVKANTNWGGQIPFMMVFDKQGRLKNSYMGVVSNEKLLSNVE